jgi:NADH-quinone oxidoreductase subunit L
LCGAAALAGVPLLSGFWSKDMIFEALTKASESQSKYTGGYYALFLVACFTAFLTAFYTFRAYFLTFWGPEKVPEEAGHHAHESPSSMTLPLIVLAVGAVLVWAIVEPLAHLFTAFLNTSPSLVIAEHGQMAEPHHLNWGIMAVSTVLSLSGIAIAYVFYRNGGAEKAPPGLDRIFAWSRDKLYVDELYHAVFVKPAEVIAFLARVFDNFLDGFSRLIAAIPRFVGSWVRPMQNGLVQFYALSMVLGLAVFLSFVVFLFTR